MAAADFDTLRKKPIPGGWSQQRIVCGDHCWEMLLPADADEFLHQLDRPPCEAFVASEDGLPSGSKTSSELDVYWSRLWPTALMMSRLIPQAGWPVGAPVLELGCGIGVVGLAALASGWQVTFSDYVPIAVELALVNAHRNGFTNAKGLILDWHRPLAKRFAGIVGSDILYDRKSHVAVVNLLDNMLEPDGSAWFGDPGRYYVEHFVEYAWERGYDVEVYDADGQTLRTLTAGQFQLLQIQRRTRN